MIKLNMVELIAVEWTMIRIFMDCDKMKHG
jgi:hypothetical protein